MTFPMLRAFQAAGVAIEFVGATIRWDDIDSLTIGAVGAAKAGDLLVMVVVLRTNSHTLSSVPSGWTIHLNETGLSLPVAVCTKTVTGSEPANYTFGFSNDGNNTVAILCYRNASEIEVLGARTRVNFATGTASSITPSKTGALIGVFGQERSTDVTTPPPGMELRASQFADQPSLFCYDLIPSPSGATGDKEVTWASVRRNVSWLIQVN